MKKILFIVVGIFCLISCDSWTEEQRWKDYQAKKDRESIMRASEKLYVSQFEDIDDKFF